MATQEEITGLSRKRRKELKHYTKEGTYEKFDNEAFKEEHYAKEIAAYSKDLWQQALGEAYYAVKGEALFVNGEVLTDAAVQEKLEKLKKLHQADSLEEETIKKLAKKQRTTYEAMCERICMFSLLYENPANVEESLSKRKTKARIAHTKRTLFVVKAQKLQARWWKFTKSPKNPRTKLSDNEIRGLRKVNSIVSCLLNEKPEATALEDVYSGVLHSEDMIDHDELLGRAPSISESTSSKINNFFNGETNEHPIGLSDHEDSVDEKISEFLAGNFVQTPRSGVSRSLSYVPGWSFVTYAIERFGSCFPLVTKEAREQARIKKQLESWNNVSKETVNEQELSYDDTSEGLDHYVVDENYEATLNSRSCLEALMCVSVPQGATRRRRRPKKAVGKKGKKRDSLRPKFKV